MNEGSELSISNALQRHYDNLGKKDERPNVLIIMTDQQRHDTINALGYNYMYTPNLDRLVDEGVSYTNAHTTCPICCPARHTFLTGTSSKVHNIADNDFNARLDPKLATFPRIMSQGGYVTEAIGKMHFQPQREHHGFQRLKLMEEVPENRYDDDYMCYLKDQGYGNVQNIHGVRNLLFFLPQQSLLPQEHCGTTWVTDRSLEFLDENAGKRPFLLYMSYISPHPPLNSYEKYTKLYEDKELNEVKKNITPLQEITKENKMHGDNPTEDYKRRVREIYFGLITQIDEEVGRVLDKLEEKGQLDNTMIIFTSDHGEMLGDYDLYQKFLPYDSCSRIPFLVRYPKAFAAGKRDESFVDLADIFPTVLDVGGFDYNKVDKLIGTSLFNKEQVSDREYQYVSYSESSRRWASVRDKDYKYVYYYGGGIKELYDLNNDASESNNLLFENPSDEILKVSSKLHTALIKYEKEQWKEEYIVDGDLVVLDEYVAVPKRNKARPQFLRNLEEDEREKVNDFIDEVIEVVANEPIVKFEELDHVPFKKELKISDDDMKRLFNREKTDKWK